MVIKELKISQKTDSPEVILNPQGKIKIKGRWMNKNIIDFAKPITDWIEAYVSNPADITSVDIYCEYISGSNLVILMSMVKKLANVRMQDKKLHINWYYEEGDEDKIEQGEYISETLEIPFNFIILSDGSL